MGVAAGVRRIEVRDAPRAAVDVLAVADAHGGEDPRDRARGADRVGDGGRRRARRAEDGAAPAAAVDRADAQPPVEARAPARDAGVELVRAGARGSPRGRGPPRAPARPRACAARAAVLVSGALTAQPTRAASRTRPRRPPVPSTVVGLAVGAPGARVRSCGHRAAAAAARPPAARRRSSPPTSRRRPRRRRKSASPASSMPASTPCIQASPTIPPPASTRTSGRRSAEGAMGRRVVGVARPPTTSSDICT